MASGSMGRCGMRRMRKNTRQRRTGRGRRGAAIVLVVALLALLVVVGTAYIVSARVERTSAGAGNVAANLDLAQESVDEVARQMIGEAMYDQAGVIGGINSLPLAISGDRQARRHDMPEFNADNPGYTDYISAQGPMRDESWLATNLFKPSLPAGDYSFLTI
jgi:hypothetical protein